MWEFYGERGNSQGNQPHASIIQPSRNPRTPSGVFRAGERRRWGDCDQQSPHLNAVKPTPLMRWLCRLVCTTEGGTILDPFAGSGSTGKAAVLEGFGFIGIELDQDYLAIAQRRIDAARNDSDHPLFREALA